MGARRGGRAWQASFLVLGALAAAAWTIVAASAFADRRLLRPIRVVREDGSEKPVTAVVPARDEERTIARWVEDARRQTVRRLRVVIVDDDSRDRTSAVARQAAAKDRRVAVTRAGSMPVGWIGKPWAAHVGARDAPSGWLLFSDADVRMEPAAVSSALAAARRMGADALSLTTTLVCDSFWERQIMPAVAGIIFSAIPAWAIRSSRLPTALLAGGFMLVRTDAYRTVGGHASVRSSIAEDRDLAEQLKAFGYRVRLANGSALVRVRMYRGLREMWVGWRKNFYEGVRRSPAGALLSVAGLLAMLVLPLPTLVVLGLKRLARPLDRLEKMLVTVNGASMLATVLVRLLRDPAIGVRTDAISIACTPLAGLFAASVMAASAWRVISGRGQEWKGRLIR
ncbi:MAG TPA: glycosyltransferase family 2 protein [Candidatus Acidoferrales bacterium]|nr:glycosyltransferase family 2 protein [Candidatus Acidoferrales bacterium]